MATMTNIREQQKVILWAFLVIFILSLSIGGLVGGANIIDEIFGGNLSGDAVGAVNSVKIPVQDLSQTISAQTQAAREQYGELNDQLIEQVREQAWNMLVTQRLVLPEIEKRNLLATADEVFYLLENYPPDIIQQNEAFQIDDRFDPERYFDALHNPVGNEWAPVEAYVASSIPGSKINQLVRAAAFTSAAELRDKWALDKTEVTFDYLLLTTARIDRSTLIVEDADVEKYYRAHKDDYTQPETRVLEYVIWEKKASTEDTTAVFELAEEIIDRARSGEDFAELALEYSEDPGSGPDGGNLGWFGKGRMVGAFEEAAFAAAKNEIVGPILTQFGYHVIQINDKRGAGAEEELLASHILLNIQLRPQTLNRLRDAANIFSFDAEDSSFATAAALHDIEVLTSPGLAIDEKYLPSPVGFLRSAIRFAYESEVGTISDVFESTTCYLVAQPREVKPAGFRQLDDVRPEIIRLLQQELAEEEAEVIMASVANDIASGTAWQAIADSSREINFREGVHSSLGGSLPGIGRNGTVSGTLIVLEPGQTSPPLDIGRGQIIVRLISRTDPDWSSYSAISAGEHKRLLDRRLNSAWDEWVTGLRSHAEIIDRRHVFY